MQCIRQLIQVFQKQQLPIKLPLMHFLLVRPHNTENFRSYWISIWKHAIHSALGIYQQCVWNHDPANTSIATQECLRFPAVLSFCKKDFPSTFKNPATVLPFGNCSMDESCFASICFPCWEPEDSSDSRLTAETTNNTFLIFDPPLQDTFNFISFAKMTNQQRTRSKTTRKVPVRCFLARCTAAPIEHFTQCRWPLFSVHPKKKWSVFPMRSRKKRSMDSFVILPFTSIFFFSTMCFLRTIWQRERPSFFKDAPFQQLNSKQKKLRSFFNKIILHTISKPRKNLPLKTNQRDDQNIAISASHKACGNFRLSDQREHKKDGKYVVIRWSKWATHKSLFEHCFHYLTLWCHIKFRPLRPLSAPSHLVPAIDKPPLSPFCVVIKGSDYAGDLRVSGSDKTFTSWKLQEMNRITQNARPTIAPSIFTTCSIFKLSQTVSFWDLLQVNKGAYQRRSRAFEQVFSDQGAGVSKNVLPNLASKFFWPGGGVQYFTFFQIWPQNFLTRGCPRGCPIFYILPNLASEFFDRGGPPPVCPN